MSNETTFTERIKEKIKQLPGYQEGRPRESTTIIDRIKDVGKAVKKYSEVTSKPFEYLQEHIKNGDIVEWGKTAGTAILNNDYTSKLLIELASDAVPFIHNNEHWLRFGRHFARQYIREYRYSHPTPYFGELKYYHYNVGNDNEQFKPKYRPFKRTQFYRQRYNRRYKRYYRRFNKHYY